MTGKRDDDLLFSDDLHNDDNLDDALFDDDLFGDDDSPGGDSEDDSCSSCPPWKIMIVDDDRQVHTVTKLVLGDVEFEERGLEFISAYSGAEAKELLAEHPDTAIVLLDVVMETRDAGLVVANYVRNVLKNTQTRIILRTGQPGSAPERDVIVHYDINDYKEKTELTEKKLFSTVIAALRSYKDITIIDRNRAGLALILEAVPDLFRVQSLKRFARGVLTQLSSLFSISDDSLYMRHSGFSALSKDEKLEVIAGVGEFKSLEGCPNKIPAPVVELIERAKLEENSLVEDECYLGYLKTNFGSENYLYMDNYRGCGCELSNQLVEMFSNNVALALDNIQLHKSISCNQRELIMTIGEVVESRLKTRSNHVRRVGKGTALLAKLVGLSENEQELIALAAPLHDLGKIAIPEDVLLKPDLLTHEEFELVKKHTVHGWNLLSAADGELMQSAAVIARQHHEHWNGNGYPDGLKGDDIHIYARITALVDVFDVLASHRVYGNPWSTAEILETISSQRGGQFDPQLTDLFIENITLFQELRKEHPDELDEV